MKNKLFIVGIVTVLTLGSIGVAVAAPGWTFNQTLLPVGNNSKDVGTTTGQVTGSGIWRTLYVNTASTTNLIVSGLGGASGCLTPGADGTISTTACSGGGGTGTVSTSTNETAGRIPYWTTTSGTPAKLGEVASSSITINAPLTSAGTAGYVLGGSGWTLDIDDIKAADLDLTDITLGDFTNDTNFITLSSLSATFPIAYNSGTGAFTFGGLSTSTAAVQGNIPYFSGVNTFANIATTSVSCSGNTTCTTFTAIGGSPITISSTGGGSGLSTSSPVSGGNLLVYNATGAGSAYGIATSTVTLSGPLTGTVTGVSASNSLNYTGLATTSQPSSSNVLTSNGSSGVYGTATTSLAFSGFPANLSGTLGALLGGANSTWTYWGLSTTSALTQGQLLYNTTGGNGVASVATGTVSAGTGISLDSSVRSVIGGALQITNSSPLSGLTTSYPLSFSNPTLSWIGLATTSNPTAGNIFYSNGTNGLIPIATSSINVGTATALAGNGANCSSGFFPLGVDASGASESCTYAFATTTPWSAGVLALSNAGLGYSVASSSLFGYTPLNPTRNINTTFPIQGGGDLSADRTITSAFSTTSNTGMSAGNLYVGSGGIFQTAASSSIFGYTPEQPLTFTTPLIRTSNNVAFVGLATTSQPASSNLLVSNGGTGVYGVATTSATINNGLTGSLTTIGSAQTIGLATINAGVLGAVTNSTIPTSQATSTLYGAAPAGGYVLAWNNTTGGIAWMATSSAASSGYSTIQDEGSNLTQRTTINFTGDGVTCTDTGSITECEVLSASAPTIATSTSPYSLSTTAGQKVFVFAKGDLTGSSADTNVGITYDGVQQDVVVVDLPNTGENTPFSLSFSLNPAETKTADIALTNNIGSINNAVITVLKFSGGAGGGSGVGTISTSSTPTLGQLPYWTSSGAWPETVGSVATTSLAFSGPFIGASSLGALVGGSNSTITYTGLATTSQPSSSQLLVSNGAAGVYGVGTSTVSCSGDISCTSFSVVGSGSTISFTGSYVPTTRNINTTFPLQGGGALSGDLTLTNAFSTTTNSGMAQGNLYVGSGGIFQTAASSSIFGYTPLNPTRQLTIAGTAGQITSSAGAQDLSADRTWTLSLPNHVIFPGNFQATNATTTNATTTAIDITSLLTFDGVTGSAWGDFCTSITGSAALCDGDDAAGGGGAWPFTPATYGSTAVQSTSTPLWLTTGFPSLIATSTFATYASSTQLTNSGNTYLTGITSAIALTGSDGLVAEYAGTSCTNQAITALSALGAATCSSINNDYWSGADLSVANGGTGLSTFGGSDTVLYTTAADTLASEAAFTYNATNNRLTADFASTTALSVSSGLNIPVGASQTPATAGQIAIDTTTGQLKYSDVSGTTRVLTFKDELGFAYATSSWSGTTTLRIGPATHAITIVSAHCETNTGTVGVSLYDGTNRANYIPTASTTINTFTYSSNNTFTANESIRVDIGTPASSPNTLSCRFPYTHTGD